MRRYLSGFVHADGLAAAQIEQLKTAREQVAALETSMRIVMVVMAKTVHQYRRVFPSAEAWCLAKPRAAYLAEVYSGAGALLDLLK